MSFGAVLLVMFIVWIAGSNIIYDLINKYIEMGIIANIPELTIKNNIYNWNAIVVIVITIIIYLLYFIGRTKELKKSHPELTFSECISREITRYK